MDSGEGGVSPGTAVAIGCAVLPREWNRMSGRGSLSRRWWMRVLGALLVVATSPTPRVAGSSEVVSTPQEASADAEAPLWLPTNPPQPRLASSLAETARSGRDEVVKVVVAYDSVQAAQDTPTVKGASKPRRYARLPFQAMQVSASALETLARGAHVKYVAPDAQVLGASTAGRMTARVPGSSN